MGDVIRDIKFDYIFRDKVSGNIKHMLLKLESIENGGISGFTYVFNEIIAKRQYTGLKDKNGIEIYEGDILYTHDVLLGTRVTRIKYEVVFYDCAYHIKSINYMQPLKNVDIKGMELEVVGNIYENKELLDG